MGLADCARGREEEETSAGRKCWPRDGGGHSLSHLMSRTRETGLSAALKSSTETSTPGERCGQSRASLTGEGLFSHGATAGAAARDTEQKADQSISNRPVPERTQLRCFPPSTHHGLIGVATAARRGEPMLRGTGHRRHGQATARSAVVVGARDRISVVSRSLPLFLQSPQRPHSTHTRSTLSLNCL